MGASQGRLGVVGDLEAERFALQQRLDAQKSIDDRRKLGQFATPFALAKDIVDFGVKLLNANEPISFLDPAFGTGVFYSALLASVEPKRIETATAIETDPHYGKPAQDLLRDTGVDVQLADFTRLTPTPRYNLIICNPPYVRHHLINAEDKPRIRETTARLSGSKLSGLAGLYCHFMLQSIAWLADGGVAGWLVPSEFMDVNYGREVKRFLLDKVDLLRVHRFNPEDEQFSDALVSSAIVWFRKRLGPSSSEVQFGPPTTVSFSYGGTLAKPQRTCDVSRKLLTSEAKWTRFPLSTTPLSANGTPRLADYFTVKRGIVTGGNDFFIMPKERIAALELPFEFFRPVLPSSRYLDGGEILADDDGNPKLSKALFLLDCKLPENVVKASYPTLWAYLEQGRERVSKGYLCRSRKCWYFQEQREASPFVCTYMGRGGKANGTPAIRFILNRSRAIVTNTYLALYPRPSLARQLAEQPSLTQQVWCILSKLAPTTLSGEGRIYGGGLHKIEPSELLNVPVPELASLVGIERSDQQGTLEWCWIEHHPNPNE